MPGSNFEPAKAELERIRQQPLVEFQEQADFYTKAAGIEGVLYTIGKATLPTDIEPGEWLHSWSLGLQIFNNSLGLYRRDGCLTARNAVSSWRKNIFVTLDIFFWVEL